MNIEGNVWGNLVVGIVGAVVAGLAAKAIANRRPQSLTSTLLETVPHPQSDPAGFALWNQHAKAMQEVWKNQQLQSAVNESMALRERLHMGTTKAIGEATQKGGNVDAKALFEASYENAVRLGLTPESTKTTPGT
jgi:hypothetical protein